MDQSEFGRVVENVFSHSPHGSGNLAGLIHYTNDGVLGIAGEQVGKLGFGIASGLTAMTSVVGITSDLNRLMNFGHYWLAEGSDKHHWSLVCGFKFQYETSSTQHIMEISVAVMQHSSAMARAAIDQLREIPHEPYWQSSASFDASALVLTTHLG